jgi:hypothetical protein
LQDWVSIIVATIQTLESWSVQGEKGSVSLHLSALRLPCCVYVHVDIFILLVSVLPLCMQKPLVFRADWVHLVLLSRKKREGN